MRRFVFAVIALFAVSAASAQIYQWKDENGKTVISDKPPAGKAREQKRIEAPSAQDTAGQKTTAERDLEFRKRQKEAQESTTKANKEQQAAADKKENCENARRNVQLLESGERVAMRDDKGERYFLEDAQREQELAKARRAVELSCK